MDIRLEAISTLMQAYKESKEAWCELVDGICDDMSQADLCLLVVEQGGRLEVTEKKLDMMYTLLLAEADIANEGV